MSDNDKDVKKAKVVKSQRTVAGQRSDAQKNPINSYLISKGGGAIGQAFDLELQDAEDQADEHVGIYQNAELLMDQISEGFYTVGRLPVYQKREIFYYLSVFHPLISRALKLHTNLPLTSLRIQKPDHPIDIVQDYVYDYFTRLMEDTNFKRELKKGVNNYWIFGEGPVLIEDDYEFDKDTMIDPSLKKVKMPEIPQDELEILEKINLDYNNDQSSVPYEEKLKVLKSYILDINSKYDGLLNMTAIFPLDIRDLKYNKDVDYYVYSLDESKALRSLVANMSKISDKEMKKLKRLGYSEAFIKKNISMDESHIEIDNDPFNDEGLYMARISTDENLGIDSSLLNSVLESAVQNLLAVRRSNTLVSLSSKIDRLISAPKASRDQLEQLQDDLQQMAEEPEGTLLAVNFEVNVEELSLSVRDNLDLNDTLDRTGKEILGGLGMPEELISDGGSYGSGFLKVELLTNEYMEFRNTIKDFIENQIFKPIAIKKGFVTTDEWGKVIPLYPKVRFDKFSLSRSSEDLSQMMSLVSDNHLPVEILLEHMGFNSEDIEQKLLRQQNTIFNEEVQRMIGNAISNLEDDLLNDPEFRARILEIAGVHDSSPPQDGMPT